MCGISIGFCDSVRFKMNYTLKIEDCFPNAQKTLLEPKEFKINEQYLRDYYLLYPDIEHGLRWKDDNSEQSRQLSGKALGRHFRRSLKISIKITTISMEPYTHMIKDD